MNPARTSQQVRVTPSTTVSTSGGPDSFGESVPGRYGTSVGAAVETAWGKLGDAANAGYPAAPHRVTITTPVTSVKERLNLIDRSDSSEIRMWSSDRRGNAYSCSRHSCRTPDHHRATTQPRLSGPDSCRQAEPGHPGIA